MQDLNYYFEEAWKGGGGGGGEITIEMKWVSSWSAFCAYYCEEPKLHLSLECQATFVLNSIAILVLYQKF